MSRGDEAIDESSEAVDAARDQLYSRCSTSNNCIVVLCCVVLCGIVVLFNVASCCCSSGAVVSFQCHLSPILYCQVPFSLAVVCVSDAAFEKAQSPEREQSPEHSLDRHLAAAEAGVRDCDLDLGASAMTPTMPAPQQGAVWKVQQPDRTETLMSPSSSDEVNAHWSSPLFALSFTHWLTRCVEREMLRTLAMCSPGTHLSCTHSLTMRTHTGPLCTQSPCTHFALMVYSLCFVHSLPDHAFAVSPCLSVIMHSLCTHCALIVHSLTVHSSCSHSLCTHCALIVHSLTVHSSCSHSLCTHCALTHCALLVQSLIVQSLTLHSSCSHSLCTHCVLTHSALLALRMQDLANLRYQLSKLRGELVVSDRNATELQATLESERVELQSTKQMLQEQFVEMINWSETVERATMVRRDSVCYNAICVMLLCS